MNLTIVAYRADGIDICRGCTVGRSNSEHEIHYPETNEEASKIWGKYLFMDSVRPYEEDEWDLTLLLDGYDLFEPSDVHYSEEQLEVMNGIYKSIREQATLMYDTLVRENEIAKAEAKAVKEQKEADNQKKKELRQLTELAAKHGVTIDEGIKTGRIAVPLHQPKLDSDD